MVLTREHAPISEITKNEITSLAETNNKNHLGVKLPSKPEESSVEKDFKKSLSNALETIPFERLDLMGSEVGLVAVEELVREYRNNNFEQMRNIANQTESFWKANLEKKGYSKQRVNLESKNFRKGVLGEAATAIALQEVGFDVYAVDNEADTEGKVDLWAIDENSGEAYPVQIKSKAKLDKTVVLNLETIKELLTKNEAGEDALEEYLEIKELTKNQYRVDYPDATDRFLDVCETCESMLKYVKIERERDETVRNCDVIVPLMVYLPAGENIENPAFSTVNGLPSKDLTEEIYNEFSQIWKKLDLY